MGDCIVPSWESYPKLVKTKDSRTGSTKKQVRRRQLNDRRIKHVKAPKTKEIEDKNTPH